MEWEVLQKETERLKSKENGNSDELKERRRKRVPEYVKILFLIFNKKRNMNQRRFVNKMERYFDIKIIYKECKFTLFR